MKSTNIAIVIWLFVVALMGTVACTSQETMPVESGDTFGETTTTALTETETAVFTPTPTSQPTIIPSTTSQPPSTTPTAIQEEWLEYENNIYGFSFTYPNGWIPVELPNRVSIVHKDSRNTLIIGVKKATEDTVIVRTGVPAGDIVARGTVMFLGQPLAKKVLVYQDKDKAVLYDNAEEVKIGDLVFAISLDSNRFDYKSIMIPEDIQVQADQILESFNQTIVAPATAVSHLIAEAEHISVAGWSPDSEWLAYWLSTAADVDALDDPFAAPGGTLHLLNSNSGESCALPQFHTTSGEEVTLIWPADKSLIVRRWAANEQWQGQPCQPDSFVGDLTMPESPSAAANEEARLSPDGRFQITTVLQEETADHWRTLLTVLQEKEGAEITAVTWRTQADRAAEGGGGEWISPTQFFIPFAEEGQLLLDADQPGQVINIKTDLFGLEPTAENRRLLIAPSLATDNFFILLLGDSFGTARIQLYHANSDLVETLPYRRAAHFSADDQWLLMEGEKGNNIWIRRVDDVDGEWRLLSEGIYTYRWNADNTEIMLVHDWQAVTWQTFPEGELIGQWSTEPFFPRPGDWSPNGRFLAVLGALNDAPWYRQREALFLFEFNVE